MINLQFLPYWDTLRPEDAKLLKSGQRIPYDMPGHAQEFETSFALAAFSRTCSSVIKGVASTPVLKRALWAQ